MSVLYQTAKVCRHGMPRLIPIKQSQMMTGVENCNIVIDVAMVPANLVQLLDDPILLVDKFEKVLDGDSLVIISKRIQE